MPKETPDLQAREPEGLARQQQPLQEPTPSSEGVPRDVPQQPGDAGVTVEQLRELQQKYEQDINKLRSSLDRRYSKEKQDWDSERQSLLSRLDDVVTSSMSEADREAYEKERLKSQRSDYERQLAQAKREAEDTKSMYEYAKWFNQLGVSYDKLNFDSPEDLMQSAWMGLQEVTQGTKQQLEELKSQIEQMKQQPSSNTQQPTPQGKTAPQVVTGKGHTPALSGDVFTEIQKALETQYGRPVSEDETFRHIESGKLDMDSLLRQRLG